MGSLSTTSIRIIYGKKIFFKGLTGLIHSLFWALLRGLFPTTFYVSLFCFSILSKLSRDGEILTPQFGNLFLLAPVSFWHVTVIVSTLLSATTICSRIVLYPVFSSCGIISSKSPGFFWNQDLNTRDACCYWGVNASRPSQCFALLLSYNKILWQSLVKNF